MSEVLEPFIDQRQLGGICLEEIFRKRFEWPTRYLIRSLENVLHNDPLKRAFHFYNIGHCLLQTGQKTEGQRYWKAFLEEWEKFDLLKFSPPVLVNFYFCAAVAFQELGMRNESKEMRLRCEEQLNILKPGTEAFSPIDFKNVNREVIKQQLQQL